MKKFNFGKVFGLAAVAVFAVAGCEDVTGAVKSTPEDKVTLKAIEITTPPNKVNYAAGEELDLDGLEVTGTYSDDTTEPVSIDPADIFGYDKDKLGEQTVAVMIGGKAAVFTVTVHESMVDAARTQVNTAREVLTAAATAGVVQSASGDGSDIAAGITWVSAEVWNDLEGAIVGLQNLLDGGVAYGPALGTARQTLANAVVMFNTSQSTSANTWLGPMRTALQDLPVGTADNPGTAVISEIDINNDWGAINGFVHKTGKYVILDLSGCTATTVTGWSADAKNNFNVIKDNEYIKGIILPSGLITIGDSAFQSCGNLTTVTIPDGVTRINRSAFRFCAGLSSITIPDSVITIDAEAFNGCVSLSSVTLPDNDNFKYISRAAFQGCAGLTSVTIPSSVVYIGTNAFNGCTGLTSVEFKGGTAKIEGDTAFPHVASLFTVTGAAPSQNNGPPANAGTYVREGAIWSKQQ